ncbi:MAG: DNA polymerase III subunit beta [candidate division WS6 bacterium OLB20]|uniref:Beta sliding clamp n=1 Tax=candidate division WS6 bacterium OLB20 TaxID=1617426 RepID=A0A136LZB3_9BACT|nr:MAG: DNA polymerase III subunit beta [candidate division WS6 bacterium OLB20]
MRVSLMQENLSKALNHVIKAVSSRPNIPVLANVLIETEKSRLKLSATNLEIGISTWIGAEVETEGKITVSAKLLFEFVNSLKAGKIELVMNDQKLAVSSVDNNAEFFVIPADDFPTVPGVEGESLLEVNASTFADAVTRTAIAAATDESRPVLTGLLMKTEGKQLTMVGVDGFRLSKKVLKLSKTGEEPLTEIVPAKALAEVARLIGDVSGDDDILKVYLMASKNQMLFKMDDVELSTRLIEGKFPNYEEILPSDQNLRVSINKKDFTDMLKVVNIFARNAVGNKARFAVNVADAKLTLSATVADVGNNESSVDIHDVSGDDFETGYNVRFLADMINTIKSDDLVFETLGPTKPGVFLDTKDKDFVHVVMPMLLK